MNYYRYFVLLCLVAVFTMILGGQNILAVDKVDLTIWCNSDDIPGELPDNSVVRQKQLEEFNKLYPNINLNFVTISNVEGVFEKIMVAAQAGNQPDVLLSNAYWLTDFMRLNYVVPLNKFEGADDLFNKYASGFQELTSKEGKIYGLFETTDAMIIYYRKDLFKEAGVEPPIPSQGESWDEFLKRWTWDAFVKKAQKMTQVASNKEKLDQWGFGISMQKGSGRTFFNWLPWFYTAGGRIRNKSGDEMIFDQGTAANEALQFIYDLVYKYKVTPEATVSYSDEDVRKGFIAGQYAMYMGQSWEESYMKDYAGEDFVNNQMGATIIPSNASGGPSATVSGGWPWVIMTKDQQKQEAAWKYIKFILQKDRLIDFYNERAVLAPRLDITDEPEYVGAGRFADALGAQIKYSKIPFGYGYRPTRNSIIPALQEILLQQKTIEQAVIDARERAEKLLGR